MAGYAKVHPRLKLLDAYMAFIFATALLQFTYMCVAGSFRASSRSACSCFTPAREKATCRC